MPISSSPQICSAFYRDFRGREVTSGYQSIFTTGCYVTVGRKDGVIADFVVPKDPKQDAEIVIYFLNTGRLPAHFAWGTMAPLLAAGGKKQSTGIDYVHPYKGLPSRTRDIKNGSFGETGGESTVIAGDSVLVSTLGKVSQKDLADLPVNNMGLVIMGSFSYCDELGTYAWRQFSLRYRSIAPSTSLSFDLWEDRDMWGPAYFPELTQPKPTDTTEYLFPCVTFTERERLAEEQKKKKK
jgi:hypothetical protein